MTGKRRAEKKAGKATRGGWATPPSPLTVYRDGLRDALGGGGKTLAAMRRALNIHGAGSLELADERIKVWSDLHLGHDNIIRYQRRPFATAGEIRRSWSCVGGVGVYATHISTRPPLRAQPRLDAARTRTGRKTRPLCGECLTRAPITPARERTGQETGDGGQHAGDCSRSTGHSCSAKSSDSRTSEDSQGAAGVQVCNPAV